MKWRYFIVPYENVTQEMADLGHYTSKDYMRISSRNNVLVKVKGNIPKCLEGYKEIDVNVELQKPEWIEQSE